jgi:hypothetical protein
MELDALWAAYHDRGGDDPAVVRDLVAALTAAGAEIPPEVTARFAASQIAPPPASPGVIVRSVRKQDLAAAAREQLLAELQQALGRAIASRPTDTYLLAELIALLLERGRITAESEARAVLAELPRQVRTNVAIVSALLQLAAHRRMGG